MRIMAIDYGDARIGLAVSDPTGLICGEAWTMEEWNMERAARRICEEAEKRDVERFVLGLPKNMDGSEGPRAEKSRDFKSSYQPPLTSYPCTDKTAGRTLYLPKATC